MSPIIQEAEARLLPSFQALADRLSARFADLKLHVFAGTVGAKTSYQGYHIGIECMFPSVPAHRPDTVALSVDFQHLPSVPQMTAEIVWGHPSGHVEAEWNNAWVDVCEAAIEQLVADLPGLYHMFELTIERRCSSDEAR